MEKTLVFTIMILLLFGLSSYAYEVMDVKNGGSIRGRVKATTKVDSPVLTINNNTKVCGKSQPSLMYILSSDLGIKNALIVVENVQKGKAAHKADLVINNNKCYFEPLVGIAYKGANFLIKNSDPILHNAHFSIALKDTRRTVYNIALPRIGHVIKKPVKTEGLIHLSCDLHPWMRAHIYVSDNPYVAVSDAKGAFEIKDLLPGKYRIRVWHEGFGEVVKNVEVSSGTISELNITMSK